MSDQATTKYPELFAALAAPFAPGEVKQRKGSGGWMLDYITARTLMNRLDDVLGPENWEDRYEVGRDNSIICTLTVKLPDGSSVSKQGIGVTAQSVGEDAEKGGEADAFKRAGVKFGPSRYLYKDGVVNYGDEPEPERAAPRRGYDDAPPRREVSHGTPSRNGGGRDGGGKYGNLPRSGGALFAWSKKMEQEFDVGLIKYLDGWAKLQNLPRSYKDWTEEEVALGVKEACRKLDSISVGGGNQQEEEEDDRPPF